MTDSDWSEEGPVEVSPGVHRIPLPLPGDGLRAVNVYSIVDQDGVTLIDAGWAMQTSEEQLIRSLAAIGYELADITRFFITHAHRDHYTQANAIRRTFGTPISLGSGEREGLEWFTTERPIKPVTEVARLRQCGADDLAAEMASLPPDPRLKHEDWALPDHWIKGSTTITLKDRSLLAVPTPGHTQGHYIFLDAQAGILFGGDHILPHITPSLGFESFPGRSPLGDYLESLNTVLALPDARLLPAHGPVIDSTHVRVAELLDHHADRLKLTLAAVQQGARTAREAAALIGWTRRGRRLDELDLFNKMLAVLETGAHLTVLADRGELEALFTDGRFTYQLPQVVDSGQDRPQW
jgi:glyoxylase-like metal-dependent hydrolase (beta-lactamase superfamily II)